MAQTNNSKASAAAVKDAQNYWNNFTKATTICGVAIAVVLVLMAVFLV